MASQSDRPHVPRAVIHKQILEVAANQPEAAMDAIAADIPMATTDLVEKVLDEYGDPAGDQPDDGPSPEPNTSAMADEPTQVALDDLTGTQRETLRAIFEHTDATQSEIADTLGVSASTVYNRVNAIEGFNWTDRQAFVETLFETRGPTTHEETKSTDLMASNNIESPDEIEYEPTIDQLAERVATLEQQVEDNADEAETESVFEDLDLLHKVVHACLKSDTITEDEELQILNALLR